MDEDRKKTKEYYQLNLDMGRIFWIVFLLGVIIIGIFVLGFYIGGGKLKENIVSLGKGQQEKVVEKAGKTESRGTGEEIPLSELFNQGLEGEVQYIDETSISKAVKELKEEAGKTEVKTPPVTTLKKSAESQKAALRKKSTGRSKVSASSGRTVKRGPEGNYYIQIASFSKKSNALRLANQLEKKLYKVKIEEIKIADKTYYRVRVGPFRNKSVATNTMIAMKSRFSLKDPFVVKKDS